MGKVPSHEALEALIASWGAWGFILYTTIGIVCTIILPLNYTIVGIAGGFVYGTVPAFIMLWIARVLGNFINFFLGRRYGRKILRIFVAEENMQKYDQLLGSEKAVLLYFVLCFIPSFPGDYGAYFLGFSKLRKCIFIPVTVMANLGPSFSLAYIGSGNAFTDPLFLSIFSILFISGLLWIHAEKKKFHLR